MSPDVRAPERVAVVVAPVEARVRSAGGRAGSAGERAAVVGAGIAACGSLDEVLDVVRRLEAERSPRWTWWAAGSDAAFLVAAGLHVARCWDIAEAHRLAEGGWEAGPQVAWAAAHGLDVSRLPKPAAGHLFDVGDLDGEGFDGEGFDGEGFDGGDTLDLGGAGGQGASRHAPDQALGHSPGSSRADSLDDSPVRADGYLRPEAGTTDWPLEDAGLLAWGRAALACATAQAARLEAVGPRAVATAHSESAAALLCLELARDGLPVHRGTVERLIEEAAGPRPHSEAHAREIRAGRDAAVLRCAPGREGTDLRNPLQVRELLATVGVVVPNTRKWVLEPFRDTHPLVGALLEWRKAERIATTYGYGWLDAHVGPDDRLRGGWTACDGAAGRMTAQNGLHNLPAALRPAVAAHPGHVFVRADLGQIEPRVLAAVSGDRAFAAATRADDLYAPVAASLGVERAVAKVAVLAAMYGQRSGAAGEALRGLERAYPAAMAYLDRAYAAGVRREALRTFGGRAIPLGRVLADGVEGDGQARDAARGRFARNAVIQGAAAELFKAWAATVRATTRDLGAQIVLCLHDELILHVPEETAVEARRRVVTALDDSARRWAGTTHVRFVADASIIRRWSDAKE